MRERFATHVTTKFTKNGEEDSSAVKGYLLTNENKNTKQKPTRGKT